MAFCSKCGASLEAGAAFCSKCGQAASAGPAAPVAEGAGMAENVAGLLCYVFGWVTGVIFFLVDKRPYVRFHAAQSIVVFGGLNILFILAGSLFGVGWVMGGLFLGTWALGAMILVALRVAAFILWILLMVKAYQGERYKVPFASGLAESLAAK